MPAYDVGALSCRPPANAVSADERQQWRGGNSCRQNDGFATTYLALDLASARPGRVLVAWYDDTTGNYDRSTPLGGAAYDEPRSYTLDASSQPGTPPTAGWVTLASASNQQLHSRSFVLDMAGYRWLRIRVTAVNGSEWNFDAGLRLAVSSALSDSIMFFGDSITVDDMTHAEDFAQGLSGHFPNYSELVNARLASAHPIFEDGGVGGITASTIGSATVGAQSYLGSWLANVAEHYVALSYGTNDALQNVPPATYFAAMRAMVNAVIAAGKVPVVPTIPWNCKASGAVQRLNEQVSALQSVPGVLAGPDLYKRFDAAHTLIGGDCIHPSIPLGAQALRQAWADWAFQHVYSTTGAS